MSGWTAAEAAEQLDPPLDVDEVRALVLLFKIKTVGQRRTGGRPLAELDQAAILRAHAAVIAVRRGLLHALLGPSTWSS